MHIFEFLDKNLLWFIFIYVFSVGSKLEVEWVKSVRSMLAIFIGIVFCNLALSKALEPKDSLLIISLVVNFYYLVKQRNLHNNNEVKQEEN
jgi:hypothetical protein